MSPHEYHRAFVLHRQRYQEHRQRLILWVEGVGKVHTIVAQRRTRRGQKAHLIDQPFVLLKVKIQYNPQQDWVRLLDVVTKQHYFKIDYELQLAQLYINELLYWLLPEHVDIELFSTYQATIEQLNQDNLVTVLRYFECQLLNALGYGIQTDQDCYGQPVQAGQAYRLIGYSLFKPTTPADHCHTIDGQYLQALGCSPRTWPSMMGQIIQPFIRYHLDYCLNGRALQTRQMIRDYYQRLKKPSVQH